jgi:GNAT superfamily N-acetyltransferase
MSDLLATQRFEIVEPTDARIQPVLEDLVREYAGRYGDLDGHSARDEVYRNLEVQYVVANRGAFVALFEGDEAIATGAIKHFDGDIAEFKKIWSHPDRRGQRLASRLLARLEDEARALGYTLVYLTTGPTGSTSTPATRRTTTPRRSRCTRTRARSSRASTPRCCPTSRGRNSSTFTSSSRTATDARCLSLISAEMSSPAPSYFFP